MQTGILHKLVGWACRHWGTMIGLVYIGLWIWCGGDAVQLIWLTLLLGVLVPSTVFRCVVSSLEVHLLKPKCFCWPLICNLELVLMVLQCPCLQHLVLVAYSWMQGIRSWCLIRRWRGHVPIWRSIIRSRWYEWWCCGIPSIWGILSYFLDLDFRGGLLLDECENTCDICW